MPDDHQSAGGQNDIAVPLMLSLPVHFRLARADDLLRLEWFGQYAHLRNVLAHGFNEQKRGIRALIVAEMNNFPVGLIAIHLQRSEWLHPGKRRAYFYSLRVLDMLRGQGIGTHLLCTAEAHAARQGCVRASIAAAKTNPDARRLYEKQGYVMVAEDAGKWSYTDHLGKRQQVEEPSWVLEKDLPLR